MYKVLSVDDWNLEDYILKFDGLIVVEGRPPSHIPVTLLTPAMVKECCDTLSTLAKETVLFPGFVYSTIFPTVAIPTKNLDGSVKVTVLIPAEAPDEGGFVILTSPILENTLNLTSALNVLAVLTVPLIDLISLVV